MHKTDKELLQAALDALERSDHPNSSLIEEIADRLAEPEDYCHEWYLKILMDLNYDCFKMAWNAARQDERDRISEIINRMSEDDEWICGRKLMGKIDV